MWRHEDHSVNALMKERFLKSPCRPRDCFSALHPDTHSQSFFFRVVSEIVFQPLLLDTDCFLDVFFLVLWVRCERVLGISYTSSLAPRSLAHCAHNEQTDCPQPPRILRQNINMLKGQADRQKSRRETWVSDGRAERGCGGVSRLCQ